MPDEIAKKKWNEIYSEDISSKKQPVFVLSEYGYLLPTSGNALDVACGLGVNSIYLAQHGLHVDAWDISEQAIDRIKRFCKTQHLDIAAKVRDVHERPPEKNLFDVICISYFLDRTITEDIISALKPNGLLFYQTFIHEKVSPQGPKNPDFRLEQNELLNLFSSLHVLVYQELGCVGNTTHGIRDVALLVAQKRKCNL